MNKEKHNGCVPKTTKTRITFSGLFEGGQKVISGFVLLAISKVKNELFKITLKKVFMV
jgi:hypothetical protein